MNPLTIRSLAAGALAMTALAAAAQTYDYRLESFEGAEWGTAGATVKSSTGLWTTNKNVATTAEANSGAKSIAFSNKAGVVLPELTQGAGTLIYYGKDQNRQVTVAVSRDNSTWETVETYKVTTDWGRHQVEINDPEVRYVKISTNSNNQFYLDDVLVTTPDGKDGDGNQVVSNLVLPYFTQTFEVSSQYPSSKPADATPQSFEVSGQGEWIYSNAYRATNADYIVDGSTACLRMLKEGSYVITPVLSQGVVKLTFNEGRAKGKALDVYTSTDGGSTWKLAAQPLTANVMTVVIGERDVNRIKLENTTSNDYDIDNITVTAFPEGTPATVTTGAVTDITASTASVAGTIDSEGDRALVEMGVCWSTDGEPTVDANRAVAATKRGSSFTARLTGLPASTAVNARAYVITLAGVAYGEVTTFTTPAPSPAQVAVTSTEVNDELTNEELVYITVTADITDNGGSEVQAAGVCYTTDGSTPDKSANSLTAILEKGTSTFSVNLPLQPLAAYSVSAWATTAAGTAYSPAVAVTTPAIVVPEYEHRTYYCSPDGDDATADGSASAPFFSLQRAVDLVQPGDSILMKGGTYKYSERINVGAIGAKNSGMIVLKSIDGRAVLDFTGMAVADANQGMRMSGSYWHLYGIDICGAGDNGLLIERNKPSGGSYADIAANVDQAHHNIIENCAFYRCADTGLQMKNLAAYNMVINCDSYFNVDPGEGNADGFAVKLSHGEGNYFYGCRAWNNSDDGWDQFIKKEGGFPDDITTTLEMCWAFNNGYLESGNPCSGNGNGFKMGSDQGRNNIIMNRCLAFNNLQKGFDQNHNTGHMILNNCTGYATPYLDNSSHFTYRMDEPVAADHEIRFTNCVTVSDGIADRNKSAFAPCSIIGTQVTCDFLTLPADYASVDPTGSDGPRAADGSLPVLDFMKIAPGNTRLIDRGTPVAPYAGESVWSQGIRWAGLAPDLGCYETGMDQSGVSAIVADDATGSLSAVRAECGLLFVTVSGAKATDVNRLTVYDMAGNAVASHTICGPTAMLSLDTLARGIYIVNLDGTPASLKISK